MNRLVLIALILLPLTGHSASALSFEPLKVLFDFNSTTINAAGQKVINWVLSDHAKHPDDYISVSGYTDRAGSEEYNMALSLRRANAVRAALIAGGVSADRITVAGRGESEPTVPTADGVKEAANRCVVIILQ
jgi:OOP family OmpA-OmpF porin